MKNFEDFVESIKDAVANEMASMYKRGAFTDLDDMFSVCEAYLDKFGIEATEEDLESIVKYAAGI